MKMTSSSYEDFLQKFVDFADFKQLKAKKPHNNYVDIADERMKSAKCGINAKVTKEDVLVNLIFDKVDGLALYNKFESESKADMENNMSGFGEVIWVSKEGNHPYIQVRKPVSDFAEETDAYSWYKEVVLILYEVFCNQGKMQECVVDENKGGFFSKVKSFFGFGETAEETKPAAKIELDGVTVSGKKGIHTYVDLGLPSGTKWATCNVGATRPTEYGDYFAWGEAKTKKDYDWNTYKWCKGSYNGLTKYNISSDYGTVDNKTVLDVEDDAATANMGEEWRIPTLDEYNELIKGCEWKWVENFNGSGVNGMLCTSKKNYATIFFPAAGHRNDTDLSNAGCRGDYWLSSLYGILPNNSYALTFNDGYIAWDQNDRYLGHCVRAVLR
ncbi:MAG: hypothetical protein KBT32_08480 [Bacteroidales bacterium]|nr:hypothetical protein [Candidatus Physcocola equi]